MNLGSFDEPIKRPNGTECEHMSVSSHTDAILDDDDRETPETNASSSDTEQEHEQYSDEEGGSVTSRISGRLVRPMKEKLYLLHLRYVKYKTEFEEASSKRQKSLVWKRIAADYLSKYQNPLNISPVPIQIMNMKTSYLRALRKISSGEEPPYFFEQFKAYFELDPSLRVKASASHKTTRVSESTTRIQAAIRHGPSFSRTQDVFLIFLRFKKYADEYYWSQIVHDFNIKFDTSFCVEDLKTRASNIVSDYQRALKQAARKGKPISSDWLQFEVFLPPEITNEESQSPNSAIDTEDQRKYSRKTSSYQASEVTGSVIIGSRSDNSSDEDNLPGDSRTGYRDGTIDRAVALLRLRFRPDYAERLDRPGRGGKYPVWQEMADEFNKEFREDYDKMAVYKIVYRFVKLHEEGLRLREEKPPGWRDKMPKQWILFHKIITGQDLGENVDGSYSSTGLKRQPSDETAHPSPKRSHQEYRAPNPLEHPNSAVREFAETAKQMGQVFLDLFM